MYTTRIKVNKNKNRTRVAKKKKRGHSTNTFKNRCSWDTVVFYALYCAAWFCVILVANYMLAVFLRESGIFDPITTFCKSLEIVFNGSWETIHPKLIRLYPGFSTVSCAYTRMARHCVGLCLFNFGRNAISVIRRTRRQRGPALRSHQFISVMMLMHTEATTQNDHQLLTKPNRSRIDGFYITCGAKTSVRLPSSQYSAFLRVTCSWKALIDCQSGINVFIPFNSEELKLLSMRKITVCLGVTLLLPIAPSLSALTKMGPRYHNNKKRMTDFEQSVS